MILSTPVFSQDSLRKKRLTPLLISTGVTYTATMVGLNELWYKDFDKQPFRFFNDSREWKQVDKAGHFFATFHLTGASHQVLQWAGVKKKKSLVYGALFSAIAVTSIEVFDGFSAAYGASAADIVANTAGAAFYLGQQHVWQEIRIQPKFSFNRSTYAEQRPETLGDGWHQEILKDYNAQTYWFSVNISRFAPSFPKWLNFAVGYGADGMLFSNDEANREFGLKPIRQYYLAIDFDFSEYTTSSKFLNTVLYIVNMIHLPAPTLEYSNKLKFNFIY